MIIKPGPLLAGDLMRYGNQPKNMPKFQYYYRRGQDAKRSIARLFYFAVAKYYRRKRFIELLPTLTAAPGLYFGHPYSIGINPGSVLGRNVNVHKGVTIGQENRGRRKGCPTIGNDVWIGINVVIVGKITIGDDVLISPNSFVNVDVPSHSVVYGNPCVIKHRDNATEGYIENKV